MLKSYLLGKVEKNQYLSSKCADGEKVNSPAFFMTPSLIHRCVRALESTSHALD